MNSNLLVDDRVRKSLSENFQIGAGNFLPAALETCVDKNEPLLYLEKPLTPFTGGNYKSLSLEQIRVLGDAYAAYYRSKDISSQDLVGVYLDDGVEYLLHYLGLTIIGAIPVLINGNMDPKIANLHAERVGCRGLFLDVNHAQLIAPYIKENQYEFIVTEEDLIPSRHLTLASADRYRHSDGDPIMIAHSSGTTGIPKAVLLEHDKFFYGIRYRLSVPRVNGGEKILSSLPHSHNCAIAYIMLAILSGTPVFIASDHKGKSILKNIESFQPTMVVSFPQTYVEITDHNLEEYDLSSVSLWFNGGDAAHETHIRKLIAQGSHMVQNKVQAGSIFIDGMGSSEMGFSLFRNVHTLKTNHYGRCVGKPLEWVDAAVLSINGEKLKPYEVGRLGVKAPSVTSGYWNDSQLTYKSRLSGYFLTGDLAYFDNEGKFFHVDRIPDAINTADGVVYSLFSEELIMSQEEAISDCSVVAVPVNGTKLSSALALVTVRQGQTLDRDSLLKRCNTLLAEKGFNPLGGITVVQSKNVPLGTTGKVLKRELREQTDLTVSA